MALDLERLLGLHSFAELKEGEQQLIITARLWVALRKKGQDPGPALQPRLGSDAAAWRFWLLMEEVGTAWPEPFLVSPPCCRRLTVDEASLCQLLRTAGRGDRAGCLRLLEDLLPIEIADRLYTSARCFLTTLIQPAAQA